MKRKALKAKSRAACCLKEGSGSQTLLKGFLPGESEKAGWQCPFLSPGSPLPNNTNILLQEGIIFLWISYQHRCSFLCLIMTLFSSPRYHKVAFVRAVNQGKSKTCEKWVGFSNIFISVLETDREEYD